MSKPHVICHMGSTVDGKIISENWGEARKKFVSAYEKCHNSFDSDAWIIGRVSMEKDFTEGKLPEPVTPLQPIKREPFIGDLKADSFAIAVDQHGKLGWEENEIDGDHVIEVLLESVSDAYLQYLQNKKVSYIFGGKDELNFESVLKQLYEHFNIRTLMLEGGGNINGSFLNAGLIDELSLLILPLADGIKSATATFEIQDILRKGPSTELKLKDVQKLDHDVVWIRYNV